jgi:uncharacterized protein (TIGR02599 family)
MLVAITILVLLLTILFTITGTVAKTVVNTSVKIDTFATSRAAFDLMSQKLSQATLNTYWDYDNPLAPANYFRQSDLQFLVKQNAQKSGYGQEVYFVTPTSYSTDTTVRSTSGLLNACGFFVSYGPDNSFRPSTIPSTTRYRYRLMQGMEPTENLATYSNWPVTPSGTASWSSYWTGSWATFWTTHAWITNTIGNLGTGVPNTNDTPLANNVIALIVWPHLSSVEDTTGNKLTSNYTYDSQASAMTLNASGQQPLTANQLPPTVQITMIVISEASATRLNMSATPPTAIENALNGKFTTSTYSQYEADLASVTTALAASNITFEILNTSVTMKESKWSDNSQ